MKSAADPVGFAVFFGFIVLLAVLRKAMVSRDRTPERVDVLVALRRALGLLAAAVLAVQRLDERRVGLVALLSFGVRLRTALVVVLWHAAPRGFESCAGRNCRSALRIRMRGKA